MVRNYGDQWIDELKVGDKVSWQSQKDNWVFGRITKLNKVYITVNHNIVFSFKTGFVLTMFGLKPDKLVTIQPGEENEERVNRFLLEQYKLTLTEEINERLNKEAVKLIEELDELKTIESYVKQFWKKATVEEVVTKEGWSNLSNAMRYRNISPV